MNANCPISVRPLYVWEIKEAWLVFGASLDYQSVRVHEGAAWPVEVDRLGAWLKRLPYQGTPNAITLGNHCYFSLCLLANPMTVDHPEHYKISWLVHELTHAWQFQKLGWAYLYRALEAQLRQRAEAYAFGGEAGLLEHYQQGWRLADFNLEQQGDIARTYYERMCRGLDASAWLPYINEFQQK